MKIALVNVMLPFIRGGAEILADELETELKKVGHDVDSFRLPFSFDMERKLIELIVVSQSIRFDEYDAVIAFKFPAYCVIHSNKILWIFHQFRQVYELWNKENGFHDGEKTQVLQTIIKNCDNKFIPNAKKIFAISEAAKRLYKYNNIRAEVLHCPQKDYDTFYNSGTGDYVFCASRVDSMKRQHLAIEALKYTKTDVKVVIAGVVSSEDYLQKLTDLIEENNLQDKVTIHNRWIEEHEKKDMMASSLAVFYFPFKEDSMGFVTMEGFYSKKPVVSCLDGGGVCDFILDGKTGYLTEPNPKEIAKAFDSLYLDKKNAEKMGKDAYDFIMEKNITWEKTIERLLS